MFWFNWLNGQRVGTKFTIQAAMYAISCANWLETGTFLCQLAEGYLFGSDWV